MARRPQARPEGPDKGDGTAWRRAWGGTTTAANAHQASSAPLSAESSFAVTSVDTCLPLVGRRLTAVPGPQQRGQVGVARELRPPGGVAAVALVAQRRVGAELEQRLDGGAVAGLGREVQRRHALAVIRPAERAAAVHVRAQLD